MGILDFFKKEKEIKQINFDELEGFLSDKKQEIKSREKEAISSINDRIKYLLEEIDEQWDNINNINFDIGNERANEILRSNLENFKRELRNFQENMRGVFPKDKHSTNLQEIIDKTKNNLSDFENSSYQYYQKIMQGSNEEPATVVKLIKKFQKDFEKILSQHKDVILSSQKIEEIENLMEDIKEIEKKKNFFEEKIKEDKDSEKQFEKKIKNLREKRESLKKDKHYIEKMNKNKRIQNQKKEFEKELNEIKQNIDFKKLTKLYHGNEKKKNIVKNYKESFKDTFSEEGGTPLVKLLDENKDTREKIIDRIRKAEEKQKEISNSSLEEDDALEIEKEINTLNEKIKTIDDQIEKQEKKRSQEEEKIVHKKDNIKQKIEAFDITLSD